MQIAFSKDTTKKCPLRLADWLDHTSKISQREFVGCAKVCLEVNIAATPGQTLIHSMVRALTRLSLKDAFPQEIALLSTRFDSVAVHYWTKSKMEKQDDRVSKFFAEYGGFMSLLCEDAIWDKIRLERSAWSNVSRELEVVCSLTKIGSAIFGQCLILVAHAQLSRVSSLNKGKCRHDVHFNFFVFFPKKIKIKMHTTRHTLMSTTSFPPPLQTHHEMFAIAIAIAIVIAITFTSCLLQVIVTQVAEGLRYDVDVTKDMIEKTYERCAEACAIAMKRGCFKTAHTLTVQHRGIAVTVMAQSPEAEIAMRIASRLKEANVKNDPFGPALPWEDPQILTPLGFLWGEGMVCVRVGERITTKCFECVCVWGDAVGGWVWVRVVGCVASRRSAASFASISDDIAKAPKAARAKLQSEIDTSGLSGEALLTHVLQPNRLGRLESIDPSVKIELAVLTALQEDVGVEKLMCRFRKRLPTKEHPIALDALQKEIEAVEKSDFMKHVGKPASTLLDAMASVTRRMLVGKAPEWSKTTSCTHLSVFVTSLEFTITARIDATKDKVVGAEAVNHFAKKYIKASDSDAQKITLDEVTRLKGYLHLMDPLLKTQFLAVRTRLVAGSTAAALSHEVVVDAGAAKKRKTKATPASSSSGAIKKLATVTDYDHALSMIS